MICRNCGTEIASGTKFCPKCGMKVEEFNQGFTDGIYCPKCGFKNDKSSKFCLKCGTPLSPLNTAGNGRKNMYWYQFLTSIGMWVAVVIFAVLIIRTFLGSGYIEQMVGIMEKAGASLSDIAEVKSEFSSFVIWKFAPAIAVIDFAAIAFYIALMAMALNVRTKLIGYKISAPRSLNVFIMMGAVVYFAYSLLRQMITSMIRLVNAPLGMNFMVMAIIVLAGAIALVFVNKIYFENRKELFVNK